MHCRAVVLVVLSLLLAGCGSGSVATRGPMVEADPPPARVADALAFAALAPLPSGAMVTALHEQDGIDRLVVLRVRLAPPAVAPWLTASRLPGLAPSTSSVDPGLGPALPAGTAATPQQRHGRPDGGIVNRVAVVAGPGDVVVRAFTM